VDNVQMDDEARAFVSGECWLSFLMTVTAETAFPFGVAVDFFAAVCRIGVVSVVVISGGALLVGV